MLKLSSLLSAKGFPILNIVVTLGLLLSGTVYAANATEGFRLPQTGISALQEIGAIAGHVTKAADGTPIANALVVAHNSSTLYVSVKTAANGAYSLTGLPVATYQVTATATGHDALTQNGVLVTANSTTTINFALQSSQPVNQGGSLTGHLRAASSGDAIGGATVLLVQGTSVLRGATADANGLYVFSSIAAGTYSAFAFAPGYQPATQANVAVAANTTTTMDFSLALIQTAFYGAIQGKVTAANTSTPVSGAQVKATLGADAMTATTDAQGNYQLTNLLVGTYSLEVSATGFQSATQASVAVAADTTMTVNFALQPMPTGAIAGAITNASNSQPIQAAQVQAMSGATVVATAATDVNGHYALASLATGSYSLQVSAGGFQSASQDNVAVAANTTTTMNFALQAVVAPPSATGSLTGQVVNAANGQPVAEAVALLRERMPLPILSTLTEEMVAQTTTDPAGKYSFTGLEPGIYRLRVQAESFHKVTMDNIAILAGQTSVVNVALRPKEAKQPRGAITGRVTDKATGEAVEDAVVFSTPSRGQDKDDHDRRSVRTNDQGNYALENVPTGTYAIHVKAEGYKPAKVEGVTVKAGEQTTVNVTLDAVPGRGHKEDNGTDDHEARVKSNDDHGNKNQDNDNGERKGRGRARLDGSIALQSKLTAEHSLVLTDIQTASEQ